MSSTSQQRQSGARLLKDAFNMNKNGNRANLDRLGIVILNHDFTKVGKKDRDQHVRQRNFFVGLSRCLMTRTQKVTQWDVEHWIHHMNRPRDFDVKKMLFEGGLEGLVESIQASEEYQMKLQFTRVSQIGVATARELWYQGVHSMEELRKTIKKEFKRSGLSKLEKLKLQGQLESIDNPPEKLMPAEVLSRWKKMFRYMVEKDRIHVKDVEALEAGSIVRERLYGPDGEMIFFSDVWTPAKIELCTEGMKKTNLIRSVLFIRPPEKFDFERNLNRKPPLGEMVHYQKVVIIDPKDPTKHYFQDQFFASKSAEATIGFLLQSSASYGDAAVLAALLRGFVLRPFGLISFEEWNRCKKLAQDGGTPIPTPEVIKDQRELCRKINIPYHPPADRHANTAKDGNAWRGISDEALEARAKAKAEAEAALEMGMHVDEEEEEAGGVADTNEGKKGKGRKTGKGGTIRGRNAANTTTPRQKPRLPLPFKPAPNKRPLTRSSSPSPTEPKRNKSQATTDKRKRGVESDAEGGVGKRGVGSSRKVARRGAQSESDDDSSDLTELEESEEEEEEVTRRRGGKGKNSSRVGQNSKGVGTNESSGGNEDSGTGRRRSPRGKAGVKK